MAEEGFLAGVTPVRDQSKQEERLVSCLADLEREQREVGTNRMCLDKCSTLVKTIAQSPNPEHWYTLAPSSLPESVDRLPNRLVEVAASLRGRSSCVPVVTDVLVDWWDGDEAATWEGRGEPEGAEERAEEELGGGSIEGKVDPSLDSARGSTRPRPAVVLASSVGVRGSERSSESDVSPYDSRERRAARRGCWRRCWGGGSLRPVSADMKGNGRTEKEEGEPRACWNPK